MLRSWRRPLGLPERRLSLLEIILITCIPVAMIVMTAFFFWIWPRRQQSRHIDTPPPFRPDLVDTVVQDTAIQAMSARLASVEGRIGTIAATMEGMAVLQQRVAAMETNMPALQDAYEKYADQISRADKRNTERQRRSEKSQGQSAGEAAAALTGVAADGVTPPSIQAATSTNQLQSRAGILGERRR